jgi:prevent-host-death family protein
MDIETMGAAKFKAECLGVMDQVEHRKTPVLVTKNGRPTVLIHPATVDDDPLAIYRFGGVKIVGDIVSPASDPEDWEHD